MDSSGNTVGRWEVTRMKFRLEIEAGQRGDEHAAGHRGGASRLADDFRGQTIEALETAWSNTRGISDDNGNTVGRWRIVSDEEAGPPVPTWNEEAHAWEI